MKRQNALLVLLLLVCLPSRALANAGTPLMWASLLHLVFGNALLGVCEGILIARAFRLDAGKTVG
jgi:hypothetical protein